VHHVGAVAHLAAKPLAKQERYVRFIIHYQNADAHRFPKLAFYPRGKRIVNSV